MSGREADRWDVLDRVSDGVFSVDAEFRYTYINDAAAKLVGRKPADLIGRNIWVEVPAAKGTAFERRFRQALSEQRFVEFEEYAESLGAWFHIRVYPSPEGLTIVYSDVTAERGARQALAESEELLRVSMDAMHDPLVLLRALRDPDTGAITDFQYVDVNEATCRYLSVAKEDLVGRDLADLFPWYLESGLFELYVRAAESDEATVVDDFRYEDAVVGAVRFYDVRARRVSGDRLSVTWRDTTDRHDAADRLAESEERYRLLSENTADVVMCTQGNVVEWVSPSLTPALGWRPDEWVGQSLAKFGNPSDMPYVVAARTEMDSGSTARLRIRLADADGEWRWVDVHSQAVRSKDGLVDGYVSSFRVVDEEVAAQAELERMARFDALTGVLNRKEILHKLTGMASGDRRTGQETAVLFCDIDRFKEINDTHGHSVGDEVLRVLCERIGASIRDHDLVARIGGDELLVALTSVRNIGDATTVAEKIRDAVAAPIYFDRIEVSTTLSIGVTLMRRGETVDDLVARADQAMYEAKARGRDRVISIA